MDCNLHLRFTLKRNRWVISLINIYICITLYMYRWLKNTAFGYMISLLRKKDVTFSIL